MNLPGEGSQQVEMKILLELLFNPNIFSNKYEYVLCIYKLLLNVVADIPFVFLFLISLEQPQRGDG